MSTTIVKFFQPHEQRQMVAVSAHLSARVDLHDGQVVRLELEARDAIGAEALVPLDLRLPPLSPRRRRRK